MDFDSTNFPLRPAWTEIDLGKLRRNLQLIRCDLPRQVELMAVVKDEAYGHGALDAARIALEEGAWGLGLSTLEEAMAGKWKQRTSEMVKLHPGEDFNCRCYSSPVFETLYAEVK